MATIELEAGDDYDKKCGEMFLTLKGNIIFHCTLCEDKFDVFEQYADHTLIHYVNISNLRQTVKYHVQPAQLNEDRRVLKPPKGKRKVPPIAELMTKLFEDDHTDTTHSHTNITIKEEPNDLTITTEPMVIVNQPSEEIEIKVEPIDTTMLVESVAVENQTDGNLEIFNIKVEFSGTEFSDDERNAPEIAYIEPVYVEQKFAAENYLSIETKQNVKTTIRKRIRASDNKSVSNKKQKSALNTEIAIAPLEVFVCDTCGKGYDTSTELQEHIEYYNDEQNVKCSYCAKEFQSSVFLHRHMGIHFSERHYKCNICKARFKKKFGLIEHQNVHKPERQFACKICNEKFQLKVGLKWHIRSKHYKSVNNANNPSVFLEKMEFHLGSHVDAMTSAALL